MENYYLEAEIKKVFDITDDEVKNVEILPNERWVYKNGLYIGKDYFPSYKFQTNNKISFIATYTSKNYVLSNKNLMININDKYTIYERTLICDKLAIKDMEILDDEFKKYVNKNSIEDLTEQELSIHDEILEKFLSKI